MTGDVLIQAEGLSKKYCRDLKTSLKYGLSDLATELCGHDRSSALRRNEFWAVRDMNFELRRGECLGLIGHNGAGKTTLLRMLNGLVKPDSGRVEVRGHVGALIALGAGFDPILTGRENIYVNAAVLGMRRQVVQDRLDEIIAFAEIGDFIDTPVRSYSSGMVVRLGFAVAAVLIEPDVLFLDEVLAVGDINFTIKCLNRVRQMMNTSAVVLVSHSMPMITAFCTRVLVMDHGRALLDSRNTGEAVASYYGTVREEARISGSGGAEVLGLKLTIEGMVSSGADLVLPHGVMAQADLSIRIREGILAELSVYIDDATHSQVLVVPVNDALGRPIQLSPGIYDLNIPLGVLELNAGRYSLLVSVKDPRTEQALCRHQGLAPFTISASRTYWSKFVRSSISRVKYRAG